MNCPKCADAPLEAKMLNDVTVDCCRSCRGVWFDQAELPRLLAADAREVRTLLQGRERERANAVTGTCPRCETALLRVNSASNAAVVLDKCTDCGGVWLDAGEFARLHDE